MNLIRLLLTVAATGAVTGGGSPGPDLRAALCDPVGAFKHKTFAQVEKEWRPLKAASCPTREADIRLAAELKRWPLVRARADVARVRRQISPVLTLYGCPSMRVFLYESRERNIYNFAGIALFVSSALLETVDADGLKAATAHEMAHLYTAHELEGARRRGDFVLMRRIELFCDAFAVAAVRRLRIDPVAYERALLIMTRTEPGEFVVAPTHPPLAERLALIKQLAE